MTYTMTFAFIRLVIEQRLEKSITKLNSSIMYDDSFFFSLWILVVVV